MYIAAPFLILIDFALFCSRHQHFLVPLLRFHRSSTEEELSEVKTVLRSKNSEEAKLLSKSGSLETKCSRLREYIRKLTSKCEEWEASYDRQSMVLDKLHSRNGKSKQKASELAHRYKKLAGDIQRKSKVRISVLCWSPYCGPLCVQHFIDAIFWLTNWWCCLFACLLAFVASQWRQGQVDTRALDSATSAHTVGGGTWSYCQGAIQYRCGI